MNMMSVRHVTTTCLLHYIYNRRRENFVALQAPRHCPLDLLAKVVCILDKAAASGEDGAMGDGLVGM